MENGEIMENGKWKMENSRNFFSLVGIYIFSLC
jgi:hypothetical protein